LQWRGAFEYLNFYDLRATIIFCYNEKSQDVFMSCSCWYW